MDSYIYVDIGVHVLSDISNGWKKNEKMLSNQIESPFQENIKLYALLKFQNILLCISGYMKPDDISYL